MEPKRLVYMKQPEYLYKNIDNKLLPIRNSRKVIDMMKYKLNGKIESLALRAKMCQYKILNTRDKGIIFDI